MGPPVDLKALKLAGEGEKVDVPQELLYEIHGAHAGRALPFYLLNSGAAKDPYNLLRDSTKKGTPPDIYLRVVYEMVSPSKFIAKYVIFKQAPPANIGDIFPEQARGLTVSKTQGRYQISFYPRSGQGGKFIIHRVSSMGGSPYELRRSPRGSSHGSSSSSPEVQEAGVVVRSSPRLAAKKPRLEQPWASTIVYTPGPKECFKRPGA